MLEFFNGFINEVDDLIVLKFKGFYLRCWKILVYKLVSVI